MIEVPGTKMLVVTVIIVTLVGTLVTDPNPHVPYNLTWEITNLETHEVYNRTSGTTPLNT